MVAEMWLKSKLEKWFTHHQCNYYSYSRLKSAQLSQVCKTFTLKRRGSFEYQTTTPLLEKDKQVKIARSKTFTPGDSDKNTSMVNNGKTESENKPNRIERRWKSLRLSFNRKSEKAQEDRSKPVLPEVLKTYDKGLNRRQSFWI